MDMNSEESRLQTFGNWPADAPVEPRRIAKAGFYYTGHGLEVECFACKGKISGWNYGDQVMARHRILNSECSFVKDPTQSGNIPIIASSASSVASPRTPEPRRSSSDSSGTSTQMGSWDQSVVHRRESARLESFRTWPVPYIVAPDRLAKAGFYYLGHEDKVQCAFCSGVVGHWEAGDDPAVEHRRHFPMCPFLLNIPVGNITVESESYTNFKQQQSLCSTGPFCEVRSLATGEGSSGSNNAKQQNLKDLGIQSHRGPRHPKYATVESRLRTFTGWRRGLQQTPEQLSVAGFYYVGVNDQVRCFHCDGGLRHWDPSDEPWKEHARWFPKCSYVNLVKGEDYIKQVLGEHPPILEAHHLHQETIAEIARPTNTQPRRPSFRIREVTEDELQGLMHTTPAVAALQLGLDAGRIRLAIRRKVEQTGLPFSTLGALLEATLDVQSHEDVPESRSQDAERVSFTVNNNSNNVEESSDNSATTDEEDDERVVRRIARAEETEQSISQEASLSGGHTVEARSSRMEPEAETSECPLNSSQSMPILAHAASEQQQLQSLKPITDVNTRSLPHLPSLDPALKTSSVSLEEENRRLKEARLCKICMDEEVGVVFLPCGHLVTCVNCAPSLQDCPVCRQPIKATVRTFLS